MKQRYQRNQRNRALKDAKANGVQVRNATLDDAPAIAEIYNQGIEDRVATYETEPRSTEEQQAWLRAIADRYPTVVAQIDGEIVGWACAGPYRARECYRGIGEFSMYVRRDWRGCGVGDLLLAGLISEAERLGLLVACIRIEHHWTEGAVEEERGAARQPVPGEARREAVERLQISRAERGVVAGQSPACCRDVAR